MTAIQKFTEKYGVSPLKLVEDTNYEYLGFIKKNNLTSALERYIEEKKLNIEVNSEFEKDLVEAFAEAGERFPESGKIAGLEKGVLLSIPKVNAGVPKSKGTLENFKEVVGTDSLRPVMSGIFVSEDGGSLVGTDAHKLVVQKTNEFSEYAGKIIDFNVYTQTKGKKITFVDGKYPNYEAVIPKDNPNEIKNFDTYALYNAAKSSIAVHKMVDQTLFNINLKLPTVNGDGTMIASFNPVFVADVTTFALVNGWSKFTLEYSSETRAYILNFGGGNIGLIMPIMNSYGEDAELHGGEVMTPEEIMDKYKFAGKMNSVKPAAPKTARPSAPVSSEPFKKFEGEYDEEYTTYVERRDIESITLSNGEVLGKNDVVQGIWRVKKKMAHGGGVDQDEPYSKNLYSFVDWEKIKIFLEKTYTPSQTDTILRSKFMRWVSGKKNFKNFVLYFNDSKKYIDQMLEEEGDYAHGGSMYADGGNLGKTCSKTYKLRAEGLNDFLAFLQNDMYFKIKSFTIEPIGVPDVVVTFETSSSLSEIKQKLKEVPDSHVMLQTVKPINEYTGEREAEGEYAHGGSMYAGGGYVRPSYDTRVSGKYDFKTNTGLGYELLVVGYERKNDDSDSLYFDDLENTAKKELGSIIIKNNSWKNLSKGQTIVAISETGIKGKLTRIGNLYAHGGSMYAGGGTLSAMEEREIENFVGSLFNRAQNKIENDGGMSLFVLSDSLNVVEGSLGNPKFYLGVKKTSSSKPIYVVGSGYLSSEMLAYDSYKSDTRFLETDSANKARAFLKSKLEKQILHLKSIGNGGSMYADGGYMFNLDKSKKIIGERLYNHISSLNKQQLEMQLSRLQEEIERLKTHGTEYHKQEFMPKFKEEEKLILYLLERSNEFKMAHGGSMSSSHEVGDTVTFNSVMGGMKTGEILSTLGADGYRIKTEDGFAMVKKSAIV